MGLFSSYRKEGACIKCKCEFDIDTGERYVETPGGWFSDPVYVSTRPLSETKADSYIYSHGYCNSCDPYAHEGRP